MNDQNIDYNIPEFGFKIMEKKQAYFQILSKEGAHSRYFVREGIEPAKSFFRSLRPERDCKTGATTYVGSEEK